MSRTEPHFSAVWFVSMFNVLLLSLPLGLLGWVPSWPIFTAYYSMFAFGFFLGPEWAAGGVKTGYTGTKTSWIFQKIHDRWFRILLGVWMGALMLWRFPEMPLYLDDIIGWGFLTWLPFHYISPGLTEGPVWDNLAWFAEKLHLERVLDWIEEKIR